MIWSCRCERPRYNFRQGFCCTNQGVPFQILLGNTETWRYVKCLWSTKVLFLNNKSRLLNFQLSRNRNSTEKLLLGYCLLSLLSCSKSFHTRSGDIDYNKLWYTQKPSPVSLTTRFILKHHWEMINEHY